MFLKLYLTKFTLPTLNPSEGRKVCKLETEVNKNHLHNQEMSYHNLN